MRWHGAKIGDVVKVEIWGTGTAHGNPMGEYALYQEDTREVVLEDLLPDD